MDRLKLIAMESFETGFERLRMAPLELADDEEIYVYKTAKFGVREIRKREVLPSSYYCLNRKIKFLKQYRQRLLTDLQIDLFNLPGILYIKDGDVVFGLVPPFVEVYQEENGKEMSVLQDGIHRLILADSLGVGCRCIEIINKKKNSKYLPYAYPNSWEEVRFFNKVPVKKKNYRRTPNYSFMRPLRSIFDNKKYVLRWADYGR